MVSSKYCVRVLGETFSTRTSLNDLGTAICPHAPCIPPSVCRLFPELIPKAVFPSPPSPSSSSHQLTATELFCARDVVRIKQGAESKHKERVPHSNRSALRSFWVIGSAEGRRYSITTHPLSHLFSNAGFTWRLRADFISQGGLHWAFLSPLIRWGRWGWQRPSLTKP